MWLLYTSTLLQLHKKPLITACSYWALGWIGGWMGGWRDGIRKVLVKYCEWLFLVESDDRSLECVWPDTFCGDLWRFIACLKIDCIVYIPSKKINYPIREIFSIASIEASMAANLSTHAIHIFQTLGVPANSNTWIQYYSKQCILPHPTILLPFHRGVRPYVGKGLQLYI